MGEFFFGVCVTFAFLLFAFIVDETEREKAFYEVFGTTFTSLAAEKAKCELVIPRNQKCVVEVTFNPTGGE